MVRKSIAKDQKGNPPQGVDMGRWPDNLQQGVEINTVVSG